MHIGKLAKSRAVNAADLYCRLPTYNRSSSFLPKIIRSTSQLLLALSDAERNQALVKLKLGRHVSLVIQNIEKVLDKYLDLRKTKKNPYAYNIHIDKFTRSGKPACSKIVKSLKALKTGLRDTLPIDTIIVQFENLEFMHLNYKRLR